MKYADALAAALHLRGELPGVAIAIFNLPLPGLLCLALGLWWAWRTPHRWTSGIAWGIGFMALNAGVAFAGCSLGALL